jgi:carbamate kinase
LTEVEKVSLNYQKPGQIDLATLTAADCDRYIGEGHFAPGSMLPKIMAARMFAASSPGKLAIITSLDKAVEALRGETGTAIAN